MENYGLNALKPVDDLDTRREIMFLLQHMTAIERIEFLHWAAQRSNFKRNWQGPQVYIQDTTDGRVEETYFDLMGLAVHYGLTWPEILSELEAVARRKLLARP